MDDTPLPDRPRPGADGPAPSADPTRAPAAAGGPGAVVADEPVQGVTLELDTLPGLQVAVHASGVRPVREVRLEHGGDRPLGELRLTLSADPPCLRPAELAIDELRPGQVLRIEDPRVELDHGYLARLTERTPLVLRAELWSGERRLGAVERQLTAFARDEWPGDAVYPELLAAFVLPNEPAVASVLTGAGELLRRWTGSPSIDGYQQQDPEAALRQAAAIYGALQGFELQYVEPPASFESSGQRVRLPAQVLERRQGTCLDLALLAAAALEQAGLHALVVLVRRHAFCGVWLEERALPEAATDDAARLRNHLANRDLVVFDPTAAVAGPSRDFAAAQAAAQRHLEDDARFRVAVDVHRARRGGVRPLPTLADPERAAGAAAEGWSGEAPDAEEVRAARERREREAPEVERGPRRIETWKRKLLDLTLRNRLLHMPPHGRFVHLLGADAAALEDALASGARFRVRARPEELASAVRAAPGDQGEPGEARRRALEALAPHLLEQQRDGVLHADMEAEPLEQRLTALLREARTAEEEGGSSNLYLTLGALRFFETEKSSKPRLAPIVLVPVALKRRTASEGIVLEARAEDARINVTLLRYLEETHGVRVEGVDPPPEDERGLDVPYVFQRFREEVLVKRGWEVVEDLRLGMFSFAKILIWRDLDEYAERLLENPVVRHLVETPEVAFGDGVAFRAPDELDREAASADTFVPMSADSSQLAAILAAADKQSFVLIGPPGTGKSQTITNLITHCLALGRKVLFVSEKMAALEVVHRRLTQVGLGDRCLELHSDKARKKDVLQQLAASLEAADEPSPVDRPRVARELDEVRERLNRYVRALHRERDSGESVYRALARLIAAGEGPSVDPGWEAIARTDAGRLERARAALAEAQEAALAAGVAHAHPLAGVGRTAYTPLWEREARAALEAAVECLGALEPVAAAVAPVLLADGPWPAFGAREPLLAAARLWLDSAERGDVEPAALTAGDWAALEPELDGAADDLEHLAAERAWYAARYGRDRDALDVDGLLGELRRVEASWFLPRFLGRRRWLRGFLAEAAPVSPVALEQAGADLRRLADLRARERRFEQRAAAAARLLGRRWQGERSEPEAVRATLDWLRGVHAAARGLAAGAPGRSAELLEAWTGLLPSAGAVGPGLAAALEALAPTWSAAGQACSAVVEALEPDEPAPWRDVEAGTCLEVAARWREGWDGLRGWCRWRAARARALEAHLGALVAAVERADADGAALPAGSLVEAFERGYGAEWVLHTVSEDEVLADFESADHERAIERFRRLDDELLAATRASVRALLDASGPSRERLRNGVQGGFLRREIQKQRRHKPIRTLFQEAGDLVCELRPCLLMSPLSVAQYLVPTLPRFDLVVFDEASQMPVWDAVGAIARGNQLIVVGDPKQLPPTSFFSKLDSGADDEAETEDLESVLDECRAARLDELTLSWHYRSRHESLIAFSNRNYYDGKLVTFPAASSEGLGVRWRPVPEGVYDYGSTRTNRAEAEALVAEVVRRLLDPELQRHTLGVVTLSRAQQVLVDDLLDAARREHPAIEPFFGDAAREPVFVKNLENVQGDERDVILFTVCYGPDAAGRVRMNFGPLNNEGGWRRLNVAITRARREILVFSTLTHDGIDLDRTRSAGARDLKRFLQFAEEGRQALERELAIDPGAGDEAPFEAEVAAELERRGFTVHRRVGCSGYRLDLALVDPERPDRYLLGIECDGASYRAAPSARDRDKLRQSLLVGLGWRLHRIWASDWWQHRERELEDLLAAAEQARASAETAVTSAPEDGIPEVASTDEPDAEQVAAVREGLPDARSASRVDEPIEPPHEPPHEAGAAAPDLPPGEEPSPTEIGAPEHEPMAAPVRTDPLFARAFEGIPTTAERVERVLALLRTEPDALADRGLLPYRPAPLVARGDHHAFHADGGLPAVADALRAVVAAEAPILESLAARRVGEQWGLRRMTAKAGERVAAALGIAGVHATGTGDERVLWPDAARAEQHRGARLAVDDDERAQRAIGEVPLVELVWLLRFWIDEAGPMTDRELLDHANRSLGFRSLGAKLRERLETALAVALTRGLLDRTGDVVRAR